MADPGFVGAAYQAASLTQDAQDLVNWYPEIDMTKQPGERGVIALYPTPGFFAKLALFLNVEIRGFRVRPSGDKFYFVGGATLYEVDATFTATVIGALGTNTGPVSMTDNGTSLYLADGVNRYYYTWGTATFAIIADGAFVGGDRVDVIDNFIIYSKVGSNQWGATSAGLVTSNALSFGRKDSAPDNIVSIMVNKREVFILGETTSEVWVDAGLFPFPFQKLPGTNMQHGCAAKASVARLGETFAFLAKDDRGQAVVVHMNGYLPVRISTHAIENEIQKYSTVSDAIGFSYQQAGHEFYVLTFPPPTRRGSTTSPHSSGTAARFATRGTSTTATARTARASSRASTWWATTRPGSSTPRRSRPSPITPMRRAGRAMSSRGFAAAGTSPPTCATSTTTTCRSSSSRAWVS
jgi:hypothetical protein